MGLHERDYGREYGDETPWDRHQREQERRTMGGGGKSVAIILLIITCVIWILDTITQTTGDDGDTASRLAPWLAVNSDTLLKPWTWFQFITYGFMHNHKDIMHLLFNMIGLFFFGRAMEQKLGGKEFLRFYLISMVAAGIIGAATFLVTGTQGSVIGASGAIVATTVLFACFFPHSKILLMFVIPVKAWVVAVIFVIGDIAGAMGVMGGNTAFTTHLGGASFALLYYFRNWNFGFLDIGGFDKIRSNLRQRSRRAKLKIHDPDRKQRQEADDADRILAKITSEGMDSLTAAEKKTLERHSRRQRQKRDT